MSEAGGRRRGNGWRTGRWTAAGLLLLLPLIAMQLTDEVAWTASDFAVAAILLFGSLGLYELASKMTGNSAYRAGFAVAILAVFLLEWVNGAVGLTDSGADVAFALAVPAVGTLGALLARFRPRGMALAMFATASVHVLVAVIALATGIVPEFNSSFEILGITGFFVAFFLGSAFLFLEAARGIREGSAA
jgi:hypothetical protein